MIYRNPVPGARLPRRLPCGGAECIKERLLYERGESSRPPKFTCPNHESLGFAAGCQRTAFTYPRGWSRRKNTFHYHQGIDIGNALGQSIISVVEGTVVLAFDRVPTDEEVRAGADPYWFSGYGKIVVVQSSKDGRYFFHAHCDELLVKKGDRVYEQMAIAKVGDTAYERGEEGRDARLKDAGPHLHFEVSRGAYAHGKDRERQPLDLSQDEDLREDPLEVLESLGPWGTGKRFFLPTGERVSPASIEAAHEQLESQPQGGYFPLGANNFWHGGVHLFMPVGTTFRAPLSGRLVAARLDELGDCAYRDFGSTNFLLLRHDLTDAVLEKFKGEETAQRQSGSAATSSVASSSNAAAKQVSKDSVGRGGTNPPELVAEVARTLRAIQRHDVPPPAAHTGGGSEYQTPPQRIPYYAETEDPQRGDEERFILAIEAFQAWLIKDRRLPWQPDGNIKHGGVTWRALSDLAPKPDVVATTVAAQDDGASASRSGGASGDAAPDLSKAVWSLFMHVDVAPL